MTQPPDVTGLLVAWSNGDSEANDRLMEAVYAEFRALARGYLRRERPGHSLASTALVHKAYLKLVDQRRVLWHNRAHFSALAAHAMRRLLVDHARAHGAVKRGAGHRVPLLDIDVGVAPEDLDVIARDDAPVRLAVIDRRQSRMVELRFFAGLTGDEIATVVDVAPITVKRDWALARAWLFRELRGEA
jgi:RNA polymerase sigma-70 factor, ECF subfamily